MEPSQFVFLFILGPPRRACLVFALGVRVVWWRQAHDVRLRLKSTGAVTPSVSFVDVISTTEARYDSEVESEEKVGGDEDECPVG